MKCLFLEDKSKQAKCFSIIFFSEGAEKDSFQCFVQDKIDAKHFTALFPRQFSQPNKQNSCKEAAAE